MNRERDSRWERERDERWEGKRNMVKEMAWERKRWRNRVGERRTRDVKREGEADTVVVYISEYNVI